MTEITVWTSGKTKGLNSLNGSGVSDQGNHGHGHPVIGLNSMNGSGVSDYCYQEESKVKRSLNSLNGSVVSDHITMHCCIW